MEIGPVLSALIHQLTQPLTALSGALEVALLADLSAPEYRQTIHEALGLAQRLTEEFRLLKEVIESDDPGDRVQNVLWVELVRKAGAELSAILESRRVRVAIGPAEHSYVKANPERLFIATIESIRLAIEHSPPGDVVQVGLAEQAGALLLTVCHHTHASQSGATRKAIPQPAQIVDMRRWILNRMIKAQGGSFWIDSASPETECLNLSVPIGSPRD